MIPKSLRERQGREIRAMEVAYLRRLTTSLPLEGEGESYERYA